MLEVGGFTPLSTTDWPGRLAAVVFVQGCPWRCTYCHNPELQPRERDGRAPDWPTLRATLARRVGLLDGVVFSGGEPTLDPALGDAIDVVRATGLQAGLHSAGIYPDRLAALLPRLDWVGLDVKTSFGAYDMLTGRRGSAAAARRSLEQVLASGVDCELRTTYHPSLVDDDALLETARLLRSLGARAWVLQRWRAFDRDDEESAALTAAWHWPDAALLESLRAVGPELVLR